MAFKCWEAIMEPFHPSWRQKQITLCISQLLLTFDPMIQNCFEIAEMHSENDVEVLSVWSTTSFVNDNVQYTLFLYLQYFHEITAFFKNIYWNFIMIGNQLLYYFFLNFLKFCFCYLFVSSCTGSSLLLGVFSTCSKWGLLSGCSVQASHCSDFSCCEA